MNVNHGEKWTPEEDEFIRTKRMRGGWKAIAKKIGRTVPACKRRLEIISQDDDGRIKVSKEWDAIYRRGLSDYPRLNAPSKASLYEFCAYMAGWNDKSTGHTK